MSLPATDAFTGADLSDLSGNWTILTGTEKFSLLSNRAVLAGGSGTLHLASWSADSFNADHYAQAKVYNDGSGHYQIGVAVRASGAGTAHCYWAQVESATAFHIQRMDSSTSNTDLTGTVSVTWVSGDVLKLTAVGNTLTAYQNGTQIAQVTDSTWSTGAAGLWGYSDPVGSGALDDFQGDNISSGGATPPPIFYRRRR